MFGFFSTKTKAARSTVAYTIRNDIQIHDRQMDQVQFVTEHYVANEIGGKLIVYLVDRDGRYLANRGTRELKRMDLSAQLAQAQQLRALVGEVPLVFDDGEVEVDGHRCRRATFTVEIPQMVISSETFRTRVPGLERTALAAERALDDAVQPFRSALEPDEVIVRSSARILAAGTGQNQTTRLVSVGEGIDGLEALDEILTYKVVA